MRIVKPKKSKQANKRSKDSSEYRKRKKKKALKLLDDLTGLAPNLWNEDAQEYVNRLRGNDGK